MENIFEFTLQSRRNLQAIMGRTPIEKLLEIPEGFNNSIFWNIAHTIVTQQLLCYKLSGLEMKVPADFVDKFKKGSKPDGTATAEEIKLVEKYLISAVESTREDYAAGIFKNFNEYPTSAKVTLTSVEDALSFNYYHEGLHFGAIILLLQQ